MKRNPLDRPNYDRIVVASEEPNTPMHGRVAPILR